MNALKSFNCFGICQRNLTSPSTSTINCSFMSTSKEHDTSVEETACNCLPTDSSEQRCPWVSSTIESSLFGNGPQSLCYTNSENSQSLKRWQDFQLIQCSLKCQHSFFFYKQVVKNQTKPNQVLSIEGLQILYQVQIQTFLLCLK